MTTIRDQNNTPITKSIRREPNGTWGVTVWFGGMNGLATNVRRYFYNTRKAAQAADISDELGNRGRVA